MLLKKLSALFSQNPQKNYSNSQESSEDVDVNHKIINPIHKIIIL